MKNILLLITLFTVCGHATSCDFTALSFLYDTSFSNQTTTSQNSADKFPIHLIHIDGGRYMMGSNEFDQEKPVHPVEVSSFYMSACEITQKQWTMVMGYNPSFFKNCDNCPVENVSWYDAQRFMDTLNKKYGGKFRLPTEAEWEFAARGGNYSRHYKYSGSNNIEEVAWYYLNINVRVPKTHPCGLKKPNELGLYDMAGNAEEWCADWRSDTYDGHTTVQNPKGPAGGTSKVVRGGDYGDPSSSCTPTARPLRTTYPDERSQHIGFRIVANAVPDSASRHR